MLSRFFSINLGQDDGVRDGMAILLRETLVGFIEQTSPYTSRVKLLSDTTVERKVRVGRLDAGGFTLVDRAFWLLGRGHGSMEVRDVERREVDEGLIQVKDVVLSAPSDTMLPAAMLIGDITGIRTDLDNPLLCILTVEARVSQGDLSRVYVYDAKPTEGPG